MKNKTLVTRCQEIAADALHCQFMKSGGIGGITGTLMYSETDVRTSILGCIVELANNRSIIPRVLAVNTIPVGIKDAN